MRATTACADTAPIVGSRASACATCSCPSVRRAKGWDGLGWRLPAASVVVLGGADNQFRQLPPWLVALLTGAGGRLTGRAAPPNRAPWDAMTQAGEQFGQRPQDLSPVGRWRIPQAARDQRVDHRPAHGQGEHPSKRHGRKLMGGSRENRMPSTELIDVLLFGGRPGWPTLRLITPSRPRRNDQDLAGF